MAEQVLELTSSGRRKRGRPGVRWMKRIQDAMAGRGVEEWKWVERKITVGDRKISVALIPTQTHTHFLVVTVSIFICTVWHEVQGSLNFLNHLLFGFHL
jgi:hypothetical protein